MQRYDTENRSRRDRPRDEYGRFESESENRNRNYEPEEYGQRNAGRYDGQARYSEGESRYGEGQRLYDERYQSNHSETLRANPNNRDYDRPSDRSRRDSGDLESGYRSRQGRAVQGYEMGRRGSDGDSSYGRSQSLRGNEWGNESYYQGSYSPGSSYRTESTFGVNAWPRGDSGPGYDRGPNQSDERGQFAGRGPKGYRRSDDRIEEDVNEALARNSELDASDIEVKVSNGEVTLSGSVAERQFKRLAEDIVERCWGVHDVRNEIRVQRENGASTSTNGAHAHEQNKGKSAVSTGSKMQESKTA